MGSRVFVKSRSGILLKAGFRVTEVQGLTELRTTIFSKSWPRIAQKFHDFGVLQELKSRGRNTTFVLGADKEQVVRILSGRSKKPKGRNRVAIWSSIAAVVIASLFPLGNQAKGLSPVQQVKQISQTCSATEVSQWLRGDLESNRITISNTSVIGGVTSGTLVCETARYSYTLGSEEPKRVLKLQRLNP